MLTDNGCVQRFDVSITYTHMRAADGSDGRALAGACFFVVLKRLTFVLKRLNFKAAAFFANNKE